MKITKILCSLIIIISVLSACSISFKKNNDETSDSSNTIEESTKGEDDSNTTKEPTNGDVSDSSTKSETPSQNTPTTVDYSKITYSALGDSITASDGKKPYSTTVKEILGLKNGINNGIGGSTVSNRNNGFVDRYDSISIYSDIISIQGGINDCRLDVELGTIDSFDETTFMGAYNSLIKKIKEKYPDAFIFLMSMPKTYNSKTLDMYAYGNGLGYNYLEYASAIYQIAEKWNLPVLDLYIDSFYEDTELTDGVHPSQTYITEILAPMISEFIEANYPKYLEQQKAN